MRSHNGDSRIYQDEAGRWHAYVSMGLKRDGARDRRHVSGARRADVLRQVRALGSNGMMGWPPQRAAPR